MTQQQTPQTLSVGNWVKITGFEPGEHETYTIVDDAEAQPTDAKIGRSSPLAQALLGKRPGERIPYRTPVGEVQLTILEFGRKRPDQ